MTVHVENRQHQCNYLSLAAAAAAAASAAAICFFQLRLPPSSLSSL
jgi:hypothetical protein